MSIVNDSSIRNRIHEIIFESDTPAGKAFDVSLLVAIILSVMVVALESVQEYREAYLPWFRALEWVFTGLFTIEYILRLYTVKRPLRYMVSFFGIIDLLSILPTFLSLLVPGAQYLIAIRAFRLLRIFRIFKLGSYLDASGMIIKALSASRIKILVFLFAVFTIVTIMGALMFFLESPHNPAFTNIPISIYWAVVTLTTVGYGDIAPVTNLGKFFSAILMVMGYAIIAVPTGIVTSEITRRQGPVSAQACPSCGREGHDYDAKYCKYCAGKL